MNKEETEILSLIESHIKKGNENLIEFAINLITNLKKIISIDNLMYIIKEKLQEKNIYFIRHAEAEHNVLEHKYKGDFSKCNVYDPKLTENGIKQTNYTIEKLKKEKIHFDSVFISPLTRTIQTYFLVKNYLNKDAHAYATDFAKEVLSLCDKNKGKKLSDLKIELKNENINLEYITKEFWWFDLGKFKDGELEGNVNFSLRLRIFIFWLIFRPEKNILIISHSHVFNNLQDRGIYNADLAKMDNKILFQKVYRFLFFETEPIIKKKHKK